MALTDLAFTVHPAPTPLDELTDLERAAETKSLELGRRIELPGPEGVTSILLGAPIPGQRMIPVLFASPSKPDVLLRGVVDGLNAAVTALRPPKHRQVRVRYGDLEADVDAALGPLIEGLWRAGIRTIGSCEHYDRDAPSEQYGDGRPLVWLVFPRARDADRFEALLAQRCGQRLAQRHLTLERIDLPAAVCDEEGLPRGTVSVHFPRRGLKAVTACIRARPKEAPHEPLQGRSLVRRHPD